MTGTEILMIVGIPAMFAIAGLLVYGITKRETERFDRNRHKPAH